MGDPSKIIIIRHGISLGNVDPDAYVTMRDNEIPLIKDGIEQAKEVGSLLNDIVEKDVEFINAYVSPYKRTLQTMEYAFSKFSFDKEYINIKHDARIREQHWGDFRSNADQDIALKGYLADPMFYRYPVNGESGLEAFDRLSSFVDGLKASFDRETHLKYNVVIFSHGMAIRLLLGAFFGWSSEEIASKRFPNNCEPLILNNNDWTPGVTNSKFELNVDLNYKPKEGE
jgi:broad specificity phosphatase PhoE